MPPWLYLTSNSKAASTVAILYLVRGLPGSGKSTFAKTLHCLHVEADMYFQRDGQYVFDGKKLELAHRWCEKTAFLAMQAGLDVCVSNTFVQRWQMQPYIDKAASTGHNVKIISISQQYANIHEVPQATIEKMKKDWQRIAGEEIR